MAAQLTLLTPDLASRRYPDLSFIVTKENVEKFCGCVGYAPLNGTELPYSFLTCMREGEFVIFADLGIDLKQLLHTSQSFTYFKPLQMGDKLTVRSFIKKINSRKLGGELVVFLDMGSQYLRGTELLAECEGSVLVREVKAT